MDFDSQIATQFFLTTQMTEKNSKRESTIHKKFEAENYNLEGKIEEMYYVITIRLTLRLKKGIRQQVKISHLLSMMKCSKPALS